MRGLLSCEQLLETDKTDVRQQPPTESGEEPWCEEISFNDCLNFYVLDDDGVYYTCVQQMRGHIIEDDDRRRLRSCT